MSNFSWRTIFGLSLLVAGGFLHCGCTDGEISYEWTSDYEVMRQAKSAEMKSYMNVNSDPCENFYEFACGNWAQFHPADSDHKTTGLLESLRESYDRKIKLVLKKEIKEHSIVGENSAKFFYKSCTSITSIDNKYQEDLKDLIKKFGSMPVLRAEEWDETNFDWLKTTANITRNYDLHIILGTKVAKDLVYNKEYIVYIVPQDFPLKTREMYRDIKMKGYRTKYRDIMAKKLHTFLGVEEELALTTAIELMDFEVQLAKGLMDERDYVEPKENSKRLTLDEIHRLYAPDLDMKLLVGTTMATPVENVYDVNPLYIQNLMKVMKQTPKRTIANYIFYRLIDVFALDVGKTEAEREDICMRLSRKHFAESLDNVLYRDYNMKASTDDIQLMGTEIKKAFRQQLQSDSSLNWISNRTRELAVEKVDAMKIEINTHDDETLIENIKYFYIYKNFLENIIRIYYVRAFHARQLLFETIKPVSMSETQNIMPANILLENTIKLPVALLQPYVLWAANYPNALKFGTLGSLIGHELIHGFDAQGRRYNALGNASFWWDAESTASFANRQRCFTDQYSKYTYNERLLPKTNAQSENIADNGGLRLAYTAYQSWWNAKETSDNEDNKNLPQFNYTNNQLFFISYAQMRCNDVLPQFRNFQIATPNRVPDQFRVIGPLSNFEEFAKEFQCKVGTKMNPVNKCKLF